MSKLPSLSLPGLACLLLILPGSAFASHGHPGYEHAMDDLRLAQLLLQRSDVAPAGNGWQDEVSLTKDSIEQAMKQMDAAMGGDRGKQSDLPRLDARMAWAERLNQSLRLIERAETDCSREKDGAENAGTKARIFDLLDQAHTRLSVAIQTVNFDYNLRHIPTRND
jgi:hypothetical protein